MILGIQLVGILFGLIMLYITYTSYMKKRFSREAFILWGLVWIGAIFVFAVPYVFYGIMDLLRIERTADFFVATALILLTTLSFHMYTKVKYMEEKVEKLVRKLAYKEKEDKEEN